MSHQLLILIVVLVIVVIFLVTPTATPSSKTQTATSSSAKSKEFPIKIFIQLTDSAPKLRNTKTSVAGLIEDLSTMTKINPKRFGSIQPQESGFILHLHSKPVAQTLIEALYRNANRFSEIVSQIYTNPVTVKNAVWIL
jgi:hypothetical protein